MKSTIRMFLLALGLSVLCGSAMAQNEAAPATPAAPPTTGGGNSGRKSFDPAQIQQMMMDRLKERLEITNDDEWKAIQGLVVKVYEAQRATRGGMMGFGNRRGGPGGSSNNATSDSARRAIFGTPSPEAEELQKAIESKASSEELKTKLAKYRESRKAKEADLTKAQDELRKVLSVRQEAIAVSSGMLP